MDFYSELARIERLPEPQRTEEGLRLLIRVISDGLSKPYDWRSEQSYFERHIKPHLRGWTF